MIDTPALAALRADIIAAEKEGNGSGLSVVLPFSVAVAIRDAMDRASQVEIALRALLVWRRIVNTTPGEHMVGAADPDGVAIALFNGPLWDDAFEAIDGPMDTSTQVDETIAHLI